MDKVYETPVILFEGDLEVQAGSSSSSTGAIIELDDLDF